jgi:hypothetical protein
MPENYSTTNNRIFVIWNKIKELFNVTDNHGKRFDIIDRELKNIRLSIPDPNSDSGSLPSPLTIEYEGEGDNISDITWNSSTRILTVHRTETPIYAVYYPD